jgi:predicted phage tail protein
MCTPFSPSVPVPIVTGGTAIAMHWRPSPLGGEPTSFVVEAGTSPGALNLGTLPTSTPTFSFAGVPPGRYFLRVRAVNAFGSSPPSSEIAVTFGSVACGSIPQQVTARSVVSGNTVTITWPDPVGVNGTYALIAGTRLGASDIATLPTGATRRFVTDAPPGVYYVRVATDSACGQGAVGPDIEIAVAGALPLPAPSITAQVTGDTVMITWQAVPGAIGYRLDAGNGPLRANAATVTTASTSVVAQGVPPGTYYLRVRARLAGGAETEASNELVIMVR